ncbi:MAG: Hsp20/alpha crystallin family protein [Lactobacillus sp.]|jgi:HSP20 family protein|nr:Hsp20/alpha crystallin family protein [Lactobacillus sp.]MCH3905804.1 Hsp20/alpha crystallin family protein [Lactobacillus sp.]MCH3990616.1 Hsp20/alpha crystallin family protein [Lactobacillus sp.]MCH4068668.1 Hsp20/alpha crystallin family protein [Lactobacillus sp.]MCI1303847.1 Hsp20/alpha crystallin family protein [Lactobacillus sp.]
MAREMMNRHNEDMFDAMNDWFGFPRNFFNDRDLQSIMPADVAENDQNYTVKVDLPGMNKDQIKLNYSNGILTVAGQRETFVDKSDKDKHLIHQERSTGHVSRSFRLPNVQVSEIHASYNDGVLTVTLPKQTASTDNGAISID